MRGPFFGIELLKRYLICPTSKIAWNRICLKSVELGDHVVGLAEEGEDEGVEGEQVKRHDTAQHPPHRLPRVVLLFTSRRLYVKHIVWDYSVQY